MVARELARFHHHGEGAPERCKLKIERPVRRWLRNSLDDLFPVDDDFLPRRALDQHFAARCDVARDRIACEIDRSRVLAEMVEQIA
jgi:hypothetical protein